VQPLLDKPESGQHQFLQRLTGRNLALLKLLSDVQIRLPISNSSNIPATRPG
jgi:hypothetical protein